jgi:hypothetical protein
MLCLQATNKLLNVLFPRQQASSSLALVQIGAPCRQLTGYLRRRVKVPPHQDERAFCFAVLLVLFLTVAVVLDVPTVQDKEDAAELLSFSDTTSANEDEDLFAAASPVDRPDQAFNILSNNQAGELYLAGSPRGIGMIQRRRERSLCDWEIRRTRSGTGRGIW